MNGIKEQMEKLMGDAMVKEHDRWLTRKAELLVLEFQLLGLELDLCLAGGPIPGEKGE